MSDEGARQLRGSGHIVTFYSFKGGTGRTMALANVAWILAANGKRVLIADWDLESPGLHRFFQPFMDTGVSGKPGIVDFIRQYEWGAKEEAVRIADLDVSDTERERIGQAAISELIRNHVSQVDRYAVPISWQFPDDGAIHFLTPGKQSNGVYDKALSALDWDTLYDQLGGGDFFDTLRAHLKDSYDYVLIDSRTGLSDIADICTLHLPDMVVDCFTLSTQGIEGAARIARLIQRYSERAITILPIPMRIDHSQASNVAAGLGLAESLFRGLPAGISPEEREKYWSEMEVPYLSAYAYEEMLAAFGDQPGGKDSLLPAYEKIVALITGETVTALPPIDEWIRLRTRLRFARTAQVDLPEVVIQFSPQDQLWAEWIAAVLAGTGVYARLIDEEDADPADRTKGTRLIAVASEFYFARPEVQDLTTEVRPELLICVTDMRIPLGRLSEVPVIFLSDLSEAHAVGLLTDRFGGKRLSESQSITGGMRYPGSSANRVESMPTRNANFTGRDAVLLEIREQLRSRRLATLPPLTIQGAGGVGKTQVALEYAQRFKTDYDIVWWLNCGQPQYIDSSLVDLGTRLSETFEVSLPEEGAEATRRLLDYLSKQTDLRWLLVYDNAEEEDFDTISRLLPNGGGHVLITSRDDLMAGRGMTMSLSVFEREESINHLRRRMPGIPEKEASQLAATLGDMPLAVATAGALLARESMTVNRYLALLDAQPVREDGPSVDYPETVTKAWHLSLDRLEARSPAAFRLLEICSVMASIISLDLVVSDAMANALQELDASITERSMINRLIKQIDQLALIKVDYSARQMQVHQVVQEVVRQRMSQEALLGARHEVHQMLVAVRPAGDVDDPSMWSAYRMIWPHLTPSQAHRSSRPQVRDLLVDRVRYLRQRDDLERGRHRAEEIQKVWVAMLADENDAAVAKSLQPQLYRLEFNLANILRDQGRYEDSRTMDRAVLRRQEALLGKDHQHTLQTRSNLAADLRALGQYQEALKYDLETYTSWEETSGFGDEYYGALNAAHNLALSYLLNGDYRQALRYDQQTLDRRLRTYARNHPRTLNSGSAVGRDLLEAGRYLDAVRMSQDVLMQSHETFGDDARITLNAYLWLGVAQRCAGYADQAEPNINTAVDGLSRAFGPESSDALAGQLSQALNHWALGRGMDGQVLAEKVLVSYETRLGPDHPHSLICRLNIATVLISEEEYERAQAFAEQAVAGLEGRLGALHPYTLAAKLVLGSVLAHQDSLSEAAKLEALVESGRTEVLGPQHPDTLRCRANLLLTQGKLGHPEAAADRERVVRDLEVLLGSEHPDVRAASRQDRLPCVVDPRPL